jgi:hypothetical protein
MKTILERIASRLRGYFRSRPSSPPSRGRGGAGATKTIVLHIGLPKAGSTSLQSFLHARRDELRAQDVYYPLTGQAEWEHAHHTLVFALSENAYQAVSGGQRMALFDELRAEIDQCGCSTVVLSSELFQSRLELIRASDEFKQLFEGKQLRVVCVLRSQERFLESLYRQFIIDPDIRFAGPPQAFLEAHPTDGFYHRSLSAWADFVGRDNLVPLIYEQAVHAGGLIQAFCRVLGVDTAHIAAGHLDVWDRASHNALVIETMRIANRCGDLTPEQRLAYRQAVGKFAESTRNLPLPKRLFSDQDLDQIHAMFTDSNRRLAEDFVHQPLDGFWFPRTPPVRPT